MQDERKRILSMLENGTITTDEALTLLENLGQPKKKQDENETGTTNSEQKPKQEEKEESKESSKQEPDQEPNQELEKNESNQQNASNESDKSDSTSKEEKTEPSVDEFLEDMRKDFTNVGDRFMQFMQTAVRKVKDFDFDTPFGQSILFSHTMTKPMENIEEIIMDIDNGRVTIHRGVEEEARAEFNVKAFNSDSEENAKKEFLDKVLFVTDDNKLRVASNMKMTQVNVDLYIPQKAYKKLSARLMNGTFKMRGAEIESVRVKTANGKIETSELKFKDAEFDTANGAIRLNGLTGETLKTETLNGRVYIDGDLVEVEAQSLNGHVVVTTTNEKAEAIDAKTMSGSVEIYIPPTVALSGEIASDIGRLQLQLDDIDRTSEQDHLLQRSIRFKKETEGNDAPLHVFGEAKTGSVLVCYNAK